ncbi:alpha/beta hydrolase [Fluviicola sp.]|uniref:alpha/beta fold hydrolase n=1 Tax=Fluviicola sp. TaxID=1917219 RepID=UPI0031E37F68
MKHTAIFCLFWMLTAVLNATAQTEPVYDTLEIGGIRQVIAYQGKTEAPIILFLHGGPGSSRMKQADLFSTELRKHFLVVQWDQRETGRTLALNQTSGPITLELMEEDTYQLVQELLRKFNKQKLYLAGESWGTVLGFSMAEKHPDLLYAYLAFSPVVDQTKSEQMLVDLLKEEAKAAGNQIEERELSTVHIPFESYMDIFYSRKWMFYHDGQPIADKDTTVLKDYLKAWADIWLPTWNKAVSQNLVQELPRINCPVYFFIGGKDLQTNHAIAKAYFDVLDTSMKQLFLFEDAGHSVLVQKSEEVQKQIIEEVLHGMKDSED